MHIGTILQLAVALMLHIWLAAIVLWRGMRQQFPWFFAYCMYSVLGTGARLAAVPSDKAYFYVFWWTDPGFLLLGIAALHEAFQKVFAGFYLLRWFRWFYYSGIAGLVSIAVIN